MIEILYYIKETGDGLTDLDATDALVVAFCHHLQKGKITQDKAYSGWGDFIKKNPGRVK